MGNNLRCLRVSWCDGDSARHERVTQVFSGDYARGDVVACRAPSGRIRWWTSS
jgi:hypothetical protein